MPGIYSDPTSGTGRKHSWVLELILRQIPVGLYFRFLPGEIDDLNVLGVHIGTSLSHLSTYYILSYKIIHSLKIDKCCRSAS